MKNPWEDITLSDYENHMKLDSVRQLQAMNQMMKEQLQFPVSNVVILGIAGGNGLEHIQTEKFEKVYGIDVNQHYLDETLARYSDLAEVLECRCLNLTADLTNLPKSELLIANLVIEYIGYPCFQKAVQKVAPKYISCIIQQNPKEKNWVSQSPYLHAFDDLEAVHHHIEVTILAKKLADIGYKPLKKSIYHLPDGKALIQMDFSAKKINLKNQI